MAQYITLAPTVFHASVAFWTPSCVNDLCWYCCVYSSKSCKYEFRSKLIFFVIHKYTITSFYNLIVPFCLLFFLGSL